MKVDLSSYQQEKHIGASKFKLFLWLIVSALFFRHSLALGNTWKKFLLGVFGAKVGKAVVIKPSVHIKYPWKLKIGNHSWIGEHVWIDNLASVTIGNNACISQGAFLLTGNHNYKSKSFDLIREAIEIQDEVWIGAKAIVCPGVKCLQGAVLTVASVATSDLSAYHIYQGNPAVKLKERMIES